MPRWEQRQANYDQIVDTFGGYDAGAVDRSDDVLTAGPGGASGSFKVEIGGAGWVGDFQLPDGTWVNRSNTDPNDPRRLISGLSVDADEPNVPGYAPDSSRVFSTFKDVYYAPRLDSSAQQEFRRFEIEQMNAGATAPSFEDINNRNITAGQYNAFNEIGSALSTGRYGDAWRHLTFNASAQARAAAVERIFPQPNPTVARIDKMIASPWGASASLLSSWAGASQRTQDAFLDIGGAFEQVVGAGTGVYKRTLTAPPPLRGTLASTARSGPTGATDLDWTRVSPRTGGDAASHVMENHGSLRLTKPHQGVFYGDPAKAIEGAWTSAQRSGLAPVTVGNRDIYVVPRPNSGYAGGMGGQRENFNHVTIITEAGTARVVTAYPSGGTPPLPKGYNSLFRNP